MFNQEAYMKVWRATHKEHEKEYNLTHKDVKRKYRETHKEQIRASNAAYALLHPGRLREYWSTHPKGKEERIEWNLAHREYYRQYQKSPKGKEVKRRNKAQRKQFCFIPLNDCFEGSAGHHIDKQLVINIPAEMHQYNRHSVIQDKEMDTINTLAFNWLEAEQFYADFIPQ
jgi:hypothetical protein